MVFKKLIFSICSIIGIKSGRWRIKGRPALFHELIESPETAALNVEKEEPVHSHAEGGSRLDQNEAFDKGNQSICCVCLSRLEEGEDRRLLPCLHEFHRECIERWLIACRKTCPLCRFLLEDEEKTEKRGDVLTEEMILWFSSFHVAGF